MEMSQMIKVKYFNEEMPKLEQVKGSDWIDLRASEDINLKAGESCLVPLGFACELPEGYEAYVMPRSSSFKKYGFIQTNSVGLIDESYCGNDDQWMLPIYAVRDVNINKFERIAQFRIQRKQPTINFIPVEDLENDSRGGFGSTGSK